MTEDKHIYRQDHDKMHRAAEVRISGPAATDSVAASGALDHRGGVPTQEPRVEEAREPEPIPGEHDHTTEAATLPGIVGSTGFGGDLPATNSDVTLNDATVRDRNWEGGGKR
jgi:hypothetical protein